MQKRIIGCALAICSILLACSVHGEEVQTAQQIYGPIRQKYSTNSSLNSNVISPMIGGGNLTSVSGSKTFKSGALNSSGKPVFEISIIPNASTGDIAQINISQDLAGSGSFDTYSTFPTSDESGKLISGVCGNGYVACPPGTFSMCSYSKWTASADGKIGITHLGGIDELSACYCFNNGCSTFKNSAILNQDSLVQTLGGGALTAFLSSRNDYAVSSATAGTGSLTYYGTRVTGVVTGKDKTGRDGTLPVIYSSGNTMDVTRMYPDTGTVTGAGTTAVESQKTQSNSIYNIALSAGQTSGSLQSCTDTRLAYLKITDQVQSFNYSGGAGCDHFFDMWLHKISNNQYVYSARCQNPSRGTLWNNYVSPVFTLITPTNGTGDMQLTRIDASNSVSGSGCGGGLSTVLWTPTSGQTWPMAVSSLVCGAPGWQNVNWNLSGSFNYKSQELVENITDSCAVLSTNPDCKLKDETWDGRPSMSEYLPTGYKMAEICKTLPGELRNTTVCRPWWTRKRTYYCQSNTPTYNFDSLRARSSETRTSSTIDGSLMSYTDGGTAHSYQILTPPADQPCTKVCKTKAAVRETTITRVGAVTDFQTQTAQTASQFKYFYKECLDDGAGNLTCPVDAGESVVQNCTCSNQAEFGEAVAALSSFKEMTADTTCSATAAGTVDAVQDACKTNSTTTTP